MARKNKLVNTRSRNGGECRMCDKPIKPGEEISILTEHDDTKEDILRKPCKPSIRVYHRCCMDKFLLARMENGMPVSGVKGGV